MVNNKYKKLDFINVLKVYAQKSLDEKWYNVITRNEMVSDCPFCNLAEKNIGGGNYCNNCVLYQFINKKGLDICLYISNVDRDAESLKNLKKRVIYWLEQIVEHGELRHIY